jgi:hypothetical protein
MATGLMKSLVARARAARARTVRAQAGEMAIWLMVGEVHAAEEGTNVATALASLVTVMTRQQRRQRLQRQ